jgi:phosphatidylinositol phospholipase C delta
MSQKELKKDKKKKNKDKKEKKGENPQTEENIQIIENQNNQNNDEDEGRLLLQVNPGDMKPVTIRIKVLSAQKLCPGDSSGTSDPYVKIYLANARNIEQLDVSTFSGWKTPVVKKQLTPVFYIKYPNECTSPFITVNDSQALVIEVRDDDSTRFLGAKIRSKEDDLLGTLVVPYAALVQKSFKPGEDWHPLSLEKVDQKILDRHNGGESQILLYVTYKDEMSRGLSSETLRDELISNMSDISFKKTNSIVLKGLGINMQDSELKEAWEACGFELEELVICSEQKDAPGQPPEFDKLLEKLGIDRRAGLESIFNDFTEGRSKMTPEEFSRFIKSVQNDNIPNIENLIPRFASPYDDVLEMGTSPHLTLYGFQNYFASPLNSLMNPAYAEQFMEMHHPINEYFIDSSHNTYLLGNQLSSESSPEAYKNALLRGCRCLELDVWDDKDYDGPIITHGGTLCTKVLFQDCCKAIRDFAFNVSIYPVILSLEVHCALEGQNRMAKIMQQVFGPYLCDFTECKEFSPIDMQRKILVKAKKLPKVKEGEQIKESDLVVSDGDMDEEEIDVPEDDLGIYIGTEGGEENNQKLISDLKKKKQETKDAQPKKIQISQDLSDLVLTPAKHLDETGLGWHVENGKSYQITSFAELRGLSFSKDQGTLFSQFNCKAMSRIYPKGMRIDSSNYYPIPYWYCGAQIVALNYQTPDESWRINEGKFMKNGRTGYIRKPEFLRFNNGVLTDWLGFVEQEPQKVLKLTVVSGWRLFQRKKKFTSCVVKVSLFSSKDDPQSDYTDVIENNLHNPSFNKEFTFDVINDELDIVMFEVFDGTKKNLMYYYSIPVDCMRQGYRNVIMKDTHGIEVKEAELFVLVNFTKKNKKR